MAQSTTFDQHTKGFSAILAGVRLEVNVNDGHGAKLSENPADIVLSGQKSHVHQWFGFIHMERSGSWLSGALTYEADRMWGTPSGSLSRSYSVWSCRGLRSDTQPAGKVYRIGVLETTCAALNVPNLDAFRQGCGKGLPEGQNLVIAYRSADGRPERFLDLATELARLPVELILTRGTPASLAAKQATQGTMPVVITGAGDPVGSGLVASLARPGANVTGLSAMTTEL